MSALRGSSVGRRASCQRWMADVLWEINPDAPAVSTPRIHPHRMRVRRARWRTYVYDGQTLMQLYASLHCTELPYVKEQKRI